MYRTPHNKPPKNKPNVDGLRMQNNKPPQNKSNADITESRTTSHPKARDHQGREATNPPPPHWQAQPDALEDARHCYSSKTSPIDGGIPLTIARSSHRKVGVPIPDQQIHPMPRIGPSGYRASRECPSSTQSFTICNYTDRGDHCNVHRSFTHIVWSANYTDGLYICVLPR